MFGKLGSFVVKFRIPIIIFWVATAVLLFLFAPSLSKTGTMNQSVFLPKNTESQIANDLITKYFPSAGSNSTGTIIFYDSQGLTDADYTYARTVQTWLTSGQTDFEVKSIASVFNNPEIASRLVSPDKTTMLMNVGLASTAFESQSGVSVNLIRDYLKNAPQNLEVHVSGSAGIYSDLFGSLTKSINLTTLITILLIIVLLLIIYRSPVASLVPLFTIGIGYLVSRGTLGLIAQAGVTIWSQIDVFLVVLVFGAGTDYCLFMISRFREELHKTEKPAEAIKQTVSRIGTVITASAFAVIIGLSGMIVARYHMIKTMGPVMGVAIFITLLASLTLTPAVTTLLGKKLFWPAHMDIGKDTKKDRVGFWSRVARITTGYPFVVVPTVIVLMALPFLALPQLHRSYDQMSELPAGADSVAGYRVLQNHFNLGEMDPLTVVVVAPAGQKTSSPEGLAVLLKLGNDLRTTTGIAQVQSIVQPYGTSVVPATLTVSGQLNAIISGLSGDSAGTTSGSSITAIGQSLTQIGTYIVELGNAFTWVKQDANYLAITKNLSDLKVTAASLQSGTLTPDQTAATMVQLQTQMTALTQKIGTLADKFKSVDDPCFIPTRLVSDAQTAAALQIFFSQNNDAARLYVVLSSSPQSNEALTTVKELRTTIKNDMANTALKDYQVVLGGSSATLADMSAMINSDFNNVQIVVLLGVFVVFVLLLRSLIAPIYLLLTVLLSYGTTLSLVTWIFQDLMKQDGISFIVPIIIFVLLVALGADYNIFLMSRVREESTTKPIHQATQTAAGATGAVITACGIILAGTFAALTVSPLRIMMQVGASVSIGILIDTFIVRSLLVPAIATILGRWNWWPSKLGPKPLK